MNKKTLVVNLIGGPCAGKSTMAAGIFSDLKSKNIDCELVSEYAKDLTWENRWDTIQDQIYIFGKQYHRVHRLLGKVDVVITDSPILLTPIYDIENRKSLKTLVIEEYLKMWTYSVFIKRIKIFNPNGRNQTEEESIKLDRQILDLLIDNNIPFETFDGDSTGRYKIVEKIITLINKDNI